MVCKHRIVDGENKSVCKAFPDGIPMYIRTEEVLHYKKVVNQIGTYTFEPIEAYKKGYEAIFKKVDEIRLNKKSILKDIVDLTIEIIHETQSPSDWEKSYFEVFRESNSPYIREGIFNELHVLMKDGRILTGDIRKESRFSQLHQQILLLENIDNQLTTLRFEVFPNRTHYVEFTKEKRNYQRMNNRDIDLDLELAEIIKLKNRELKRLTMEEAKEKVKKILKREKNGITISNSLISILLEQEGYILLKTEIKEIRGLLGICAAKYRKNKIV